MKREKDELFITKVRHAFFTKTKQMKNDILKFLNFVELTFAEIICIFRGTLISPKNEKNKFRENLYP